MMKLMQVHEKVDVIQISKDDDSPKIQNFLEKDHVGPSKTLQLYAKYFLSWLMIDDFFFFFFLNGPLS